MRFLLALLFFLGGVVGAQAQVLTPGVAVAQVSISNTDVQNSAAIQAAEALLPNGGEVWIPPGIYQFAGLNISQGIILKGLGAFVGTMSLGPQSQATTRLIYTGTGTAITVQDANGWGIENLSLDVANVSSTAVGLLTVNASTGDVKNLLIQNFGGFGIRETTTGATMRSRWQQVQVILPSQSSSAMGVFISGDGDSDVFDDVWEGLLIVPTASTHTGLYIASADSVDFRHLVIFPAKARGIVFDYTVWSGFPNNLTFFSLDPYTNSITNVGTAPTQANLANKIYRFLTANGGVIPQIPNLQVVD